MAKIFLVISIIVTAITAALGFMTKAKVENLKTERENYKQGEAAAKNEVAKTTAQLKTTKEQLTAANKDLEDQKAKVTSLEGDVKAAKEDAEKAKGDVEAKAKQIADLEDKLKAAGKPTTTGPATDNTESVRLTEELKKAQGELAEAKQVQSTLQARAKDYESQLAAAKTTIEHYEKPIDLAGKTGRVVAVNPGWNFAVIDVGDRRGATLNAPLIVTRGGQMVGRLKITSVEPNTSIADIVPGSVSRGDAVQAGDRIVFAGRSTTQAPKEGAPSDQKPGAGEGANKPQGGGAAPKLPER